MRDYAAYRKTDSYREAQRRYKTSPKRRATTRKSYHEQRKAALNMLGGRCERCGFDDDRALQIDHINGGGTKEHKLHRADWIYRQVLKGSSDYQILCANCNWIKRSENGEQPQPRLG